MRTLGASVGEGGVNRRPDVILAQQLLNRHQPPRRPLLRLDGIVGPRTQAAIRAFQARVVHLRDVDGRIDPRGPTIRHLRFAPHEITATRSPVHQPPLRPALHQPAPPVPATAHAPSPSASPAHAPSPPASPAHAPSPPASPAPARFPPASSAPAPAPAAPPAAQEAAGHRDVIAWGARVSRTFKLKVLEITRRLDISPDFLMSCMAFESGETFSPSIRNAAGSGAVGLIQFMPSTARALHTTVEALAAMIPERQLDYVERYFQPYRGRIQVIEDIYMMILFPKAIGRPADFQLFTRGTTAYRQNRGLDADRNGAVSKYEAAAAVRAKYAKGLRPGFIG
jgi:peptidoglycan hydrolase-like protein with peptidoglycan-binding domain